MKAYIEDSLTVGEILDFIKEMNISKNNKIFHDIVGSNIINSFRILSDVRILDINSDIYKDYKNIILFTDDTKDKDLNNSLSLSDFLEYASQVSRDSIIIYYDGENLYSGVFLHIKKKVLTIYVCKLLIINQ